jgi:hypothetical protein
MDRFRSGTIGTEMVVMKEEQQLSWYGPRHAYEECKSVRHVAE